MEELTNESLFMTFTAKVKPAKTAGNSEKTYPEHRLSPPEDAAERFFKITRRQKLKHTAFLQTVISLSDSKYFGKRDWGGRGRK